MVNFCRMIELLKREGFYFNMVDGWEGFREDRRVKIGFERDGS